MTEFTSMGVVKHSFAVFGPQLNLKVFKSITSSSEEYFCREKVDQFSVTSWCIVNSCLCVQQSQPNIEMLRLVEMVRDVAAGLSYAHDMGVLHRVSTITIYDFGKKFFSIFVI